MTSPHVPESHRAVILAFIVFAVITAIVFLPGFFRSEAVSGGREKGLFPRTSSQDPDLPNYDIRLDKKASNKIAALRGRARKDAADVAGARDKFVRAENALKARVPNLNVEYNQTLQAPEVIGPDPKMGKGTLAQASNGRRAEVLKGFLKQNKDLVGASDEQVNSLKVTAEYTNPNGELSFVVAEQEINGIPVFQGEIKAGFNKQGEMFRIISNFAPGLDRSSARTDFRNPADAVRAAAANLNSSLDEAELASFTQDAEGKNLMFGSGSRAITAEKMYFPTEPGVTIPAWRVLLWHKQAAYYLIVDSETGEILWRKNLTENQTPIAPVTYQVYRNINAFIDVADNPAPLTPGPVSPLMGTQGTLLTRQNVTLSGNEGVLAFNKIGWIANGDQITKGNNVWSGLDLSSPDGIDIASEADAVNRVFTSAWNPPPGTPTQPTSDAQARQGAVIQQFYVVNRYHDALYLLGFREESRNFQNDNFGLAAGWADPVHAEGQDVGGQNNANFTTRADGQPGIMQMYVWSNGRDGTGDAEIIIHELTHGLSNRLHGNAVGLSNSMARAMGEGWGDFYALSLLSEPSDPLGGVYGFGGYTLLGFFGPPSEPDYLSNYYYGIRRFPKAIMSAKGPNNRPHNPLTFEDIDSEDADVNDGAFVPAFNGPADQVHNAGEIWSSALWEVRALFIQRLGWAEGNRRILQFVTDGMKLSPIDPTFLSGRDAIVDAALQGGGTTADIQDIWKGFSIRGMGTGATIQNVGSGGTTRVTESFDPPNVISTPSFTISDALGDNDGILEPGETVTMTVPLTNKTGFPVQNVKLRVSGMRAIVYGAIPHKSTVTRQINFQIPSATACGALLNIKFYVQSSLGHTVIDNMVSLGNPVTSYTENFDIGVTLPNFPSGWSATATYNPMKFVTTTTGPDSAPYSAFAANLPNCPFDDLGSPSCPTTAGGDTALISAPIPINIETARLMFKHRYNTETGWDGGVLEISLDDGLSYKDLVAAGGSFEIRGYNGSLGPGENNPLAGRAAWTGNSAGWQSTTARLPAAAAGKSVRLRWRFGTDNNTGPAGGGWNIDTISVAGNAACSFTP